MSRWLVVVLALVFPLGSGLSVQDWDGTGDALIISLGAASTVVGALIALRLPRNPIGWLFLVAGASNGVAAAAHAYAQRWVDGEGGDRTLAELAAVYGDASWMPFILLPVTFLLLLFPDGRLPSRRWRPVAWCAGAGLAVGFAIEIVWPGPTEDFPTIENPIGWSSGAADPVMGLSWLLLLIGILGSAAALAHRFRASAGEERQQLKWLALAGGVAAVAIPVGVAGFDIWGADGTNVICMAAVLGLPLATGVAILRHRLFDIDVVINRTLVYGALTMTVAGAYALTVLLLQLVVSPSSDVAVAASTLAAAALVRPARAGIQEAVDRRFYRRAYDARQTVQAFASQLRDEVTLDGLDRELRDAVHTALAPAHVSLWVPPR